MSDPVLRTILLLVALEALAIFVPLAMLALARRAV
jgi:hypothetical protein